MAKKQSAAASPKRKKSSKKVSAAPSVLDPDVALAILKRGAEGLNDWWKLFAGPNAAGRPTVDLSQADLRGAKLNDYWLDTATLAGANLAQAQLKGATLGRLSETTLDRAKLVGAKIRGLERCSVVKADLSGVRFVGEKNAPPSLAGSKLVETKLNGAMSADLHADELIADQASFAETLFERGSFPRASFRGARFEKAEFYSCDFTDADFTGADLRGAIFARCRFERANLSQAQLAGANFAQCDFSQATVGDADFQNAHLNGATFAGVDLSASKELAAALAARDARPRPSLKRLDALSEAFGKLISASSNIVVQMSNGGRVELSWRLLRRSTEAQWTWYREKRSRNALTRGAPGTSLREQLCFLGDLWSVGRLAGESFEATKSGELSATVFGRLALGAWLDAFAVNVDSPDELQRFDVFVNAVAQHVNAGKLSRALQMLQTESVQLFNEVNDDHVAAIVKSQSSEDTIYACRLTAEGRFACCDQHLSPCMGMGVGEKREVCKHALVMLLGLAKADRLSRSSALSWLEATKKRGGKKGAVDENLMAEILVRYKGASVGEIDWRPMETTPEDFYSI